VLITHAKYTDLGNPSHLTAVQYRPGAGQSLSVTNGVYTRLRGKVFFDCIGWTGSEDFVLNRIHAYDNRYGDNILFDVAPTEGTTGRREITNSDIDGYVRLYRLSRWKLEGSIFARIGFTTSSNPPVSVKNNMIIDPIQRTGAMALADCVGDIEDTYILDMGVTRDHIEGKITYTRANLKGGVYESALANPQGNGGSWIATNNNAISVASDAPSEISHWLITLSPDGVGSAGIIQMKGTKWSGVTLKNNTVPITGAVSPQFGGAIAGSGAASNVFAGQYEDILNNLFWIPDGKRQDSGDYGIFALSSSVVSGTALAGSTATAIVSATTLTTGDRSLDGTYKVKITSGPDAGLIRSVASNTATTFTVSPAFPNSTLGQTYIAYPVDVVVSSRYNAWYGFLTNGSQGDADGVVTANTKKGYSGFYNTTPTSIGANDLSVASPNFVDTTRSVSTFATAYLGKAEATAWATSTAYAAGDERAASVTGYYGGRPINYVCTHPHISTANNKPGSLTETLTAVTTSAATPVVVAHPAHGKVTGDRMQIAAASRTGLMGTWTITVIDANSYSLDGSSDTATGTASARHSWRNYWEFQGVAEIRKTSMTTTGYLSNATIANLLAWVKGGYAPQNSQLKSAGFGGVDIGAVSVLSAAVEGVFTAALSPMEPEILGKIGCGGGVSCTAGEISYTSGGGAGNSGAINIALSCDVNLAGASGVDGVISAAIEAILDGVGNSGCNATLAAAMEALNLQLINVAIGERIYRISFSTKTGQITITTD